MTADAVEVLGTDDGRRRLVPTIVAGVLIVGAIAVLATRGTTHHNAAPAPAVPHPAPSVPLVSAVPADPPPESVGRVGDIAVVLGHTAHTPSYGTITTLDGPSAFSPVTNEINDGVALAVAGTGTTAWLAVKHTVQGAGGPASIEGVDLRGQAGLIGAELPAIPHSIAVVAGRVWVGLDGRVAEYDPTTQQLRLHRVAPGAIVDLVADPDGRYLYGAASDGTNIVRWRLPGLVEEVARTVPSGMHVTHLAYWNGSLWASAVDESLTVGRVLPIEADNLGDEAGGPLAHDGPVQAVYAGTAELWLLDAGHRQLRCVRPTTTGWRLGAPTALQPLEPADASSDLLVAVGDRVYVDVQNGPVTYVASVVCPAT